MPNEHGVKQSNVFGVHARSSIHFLGSYADERAWGEAN
jgi:hypothetical protein